jgi:hypothetical protein
VGAENSITAAEQVKRDPLRESGQTLSVAVLKEHFLSLAQHGRLLSI